MIINNTNINEIKEYLHFSPLPKDEQDNWKCADRNCKDYGDFYWYVFLNGTSVMVPLCEMHADLKQLMQKKSGLFDF